MGSKTERERKRREKKFEKKQIFFLRFFLGLSQSTFLKGAKFLIFFFLFFLFVSFFFFLFYDSSFFALFVGGEVGSFEEHSIGSSSEDASEKMMWVLFTPPFDVFRFFVFSSVFFLLLSLCVSTVLLTFSSSVGVNG